MNPEYIVLLPILIPLAGAFVILFIRPWPLWQARTAFVIMFFSLLSSVLLLFSVLRSSQAMVYQAGGWIAPVGISLVGDYLSAFTVMMSQLVLFTGVIYAMGAKDKSIQYPTFYSLLLALAAGLTGAFLTGDVFSLFVFTELLVISGTVLTAISDDRFGVEAAFKYFYMSLLASAFLLLAIGSLYVSYGSLNMADLAVRIQTDPGQPLLPFAIALLMATFMVKSAVFPFHFWQPDFHTAAPTAVSAMLSSVVVKLGIYGFIRMTTLLFIYQSKEIQLLLIGLGILGVFIGGLSAVSTHNVKRMLAYSTLSQIGFILVGIGWGTTLSITAALVFTFNHSLIKAAMLMLAGSVASRTKVKSAAFEVVTGVGRYMPFAGILFFIGSLALAGIPPTNGFINKLLTFESGIDLGAFLVLVLLAIGGLITLLYSMRAFQRIWWYPKTKENEVKTAGDRLIAPAMLIVLVLILGLWSQPLIQISEATSIWLQDPLNYINSVLGSTFADRFGGG
jgi:multicomponent Na+:H+ antiporter subunit D